MKRKNIYGLVTGISMLIGTLLVGYGFYCSSKIEESDKKASRSYCIGLSLLVTSYIVGEEIKSNLKKQNKLEKLSLK